ncbi:hypothetical protein JCGZ_16297 [Jatropha curcas]|uniref:RING-type domain-containing protein n=1 Tax=Jatropha curcas TaxID=180498 RepID=A0A067LJJ6_JATCU|nr:probable E3 ubiquitin-protein ligase RHY1A [Jatropha curcas]KDP44464.1 hypothetical protein JCGZ_16297 [Jatropha curcas]
MTSASELFYPRRSRVGRTTNAEHEHSSSDRNFHLNYARRHHHHNHNHSRHDLDGWDPLRRSPHVRHPCHRLSSHNERALVRVDEGTSQLPSNGAGTETLSSASRPTLTGNDRLPGTVLLARARLLERLRGVSLSGNRRSARVSFGIYNREYTFGDDLRVADAEDWGTDIAPGLPARGTSFTNSTYQAERLQLVQESYKKKPPGLTSEDLDCLQVELFSSFERGVETEISRVWWDCSICLESFKEGDKLVRLPCEHRFHAACLDPWVRTCGDCPYCRRDIVVGSHKS